MKLLIGIFGVLTLFSCKKDYTCECFVAGSTTTNEVYQLNNMTEKDAIDKCDSYDENNVIFGLTVIKDCRIK